MRGALVVVLGSAALGRGAGASGWEGREGEEGVRPLPNVNGAPTPPCLGTCALEPSCPLPEGAHALEVHLGAASSPPQAPPAPARDQGALPCSPGWPTALASPPAWGPQQGREPGADTAQSLRQFLLQLRLF